MIYWTWKLCIMTFENAVLAENYGVVIVSFYKDSIKVKGREL